MSTTIDNKIVQVTFDNARFEKAISESKASLSDFEKHVGNVKTGDGLQGIEASIDTLSNKFSLLGVAAATAIGTITNNLVTKGLSKLHASFASVLEPLTTGGEQRAANIERARTMLEGLGLDVESAMKSADEAVTGTAYGLDEAARAAAQFAAAGVGMGNEMTGTLKGVSGLAAVTGSSYDDIANIFMKIAGQGRVMGDDLNRIGVRGINAAALLAKAYGTSETKLREMVSKGKVSFKDFAKVMQVEFADQAFKANETFEGSMANMQTALKRVGADFALLRRESQIPVFNAQSDTIKALQKALEPLRKMYELWVNFVSKTKTDIFKKLAEGIRTFSEYFVKYNAEGKVAGLTALSNKLIIGFQGVIAIFKIVGRTIQFVFDVIGEFISIFTGGSTQKVLDGVGNMAEGFGAFFINLEQGEASAESFAGRLLAVRDAFSKVKNFLSDVTKNIKKFFSIIGDGLKPAINFVKKVLTPIGDIFKKLKSWIKPTVKPMNEFHGSIKGLSDEVSNNPIITFFSNFKDGIFKVKDAIGSALPSIGSFFSGVGSQIDTTGIQTAFGKIKDFVGNVFNKQDKKQTGIKFDVVSNIPKVGQKIVDWIKNIWDRFKEFGAYVSKLDIFSGLLEAFNGIINLDPTRIKDGFTKAVDGVKTAVKDAGDYIRNFDFKATIEKVTNSDAFQGIKDVFNNIKQGFVDLSNAGHKEGASPIEKFFAFLSDTGGTAWSGLKTIGSAIKTFFEDMASGNKKLDIGAIVKDFGDFAKGLIPAIDPLKKVGEAIQTIKDTITGDTAKSAGVGVGNFLSGMASVKIDEAGIDNVLDIVERCVGIFIGASFGQFMRDMGSLPRTISKTLEKFADLGSSSPLDKIGGFFKKLGKTFLELAVSVVIMTIALYALSKIKNIDEALMNLGKLLAMMSGAIGAIAGIGKLTGNVENAGRAMLGLSVGLGVMIMSVKSLGKMKPEVLKQGTDAVVKLIITMTAAIKAIGLNIKAFGKKGSGVDTSNQLKGVASTMLMFGISMRILVSSVKSLGKMDPDQLSQGMQSAMILIGTMTAALKLLSSNISAGGKGGGFSMISEKGGVASMLLGLSAAMFIMVNAVKAFGTMNPDQLQQGLIGFGTVIGGLTASLVLMQQKVASAKPGDLKTLAILLVEIAGAVGALMAIMIEVAKQPMENMTLAMAAFGEVIGGLTASMILLSKQMSKATVTGKDMTIVAAAMDIIAGGIAGLLGVMAYVAQQPIEGIKIAMWAMGEAIAAMVGSLIGLSIYLEKSGANAASLTTIGTSLAIVAGGISAVLSATALLAQQPIDGIQQSMWAMGEAVAGLTAAIAVLGKINLKPAQMEKVAISFAAIAAGVTAVLGGMAAFAASGSPEQQGMAMAALAETIAAIGIALGALSPLGPGVLAVGVAVAAFGAGLMLAALAGEKFITNMILMGSIPKEIIINAVNNICDAVIQGFKRVPEIVAAAVDAFIGSLNALGERMDEVAEAVVSFVEKFAEAFDEERMTRLGNALMEFIIGAINAAANVIRENAEDFGKAVGNFVGAIFTGIVDGIKGFASGIAEAIGGKVSEDAKKVEVEEVKLTDEQMGKLINNPDAATEIGKDILENITLGLNDFDLLKEMSRVLNETVIDGVTGKGANHLIAGTGLAGCKKIGANIIAGLTAGIKDTTSAEYLALVQAAKDLGEKAAAKVKEGAQEKSPSKLTEKVGKFLVAGLTVGLGDSSELGKMSKSIFGVGKAIENDFLTATEERSPSKMTYRVGNDLILGLAGGISDRTKLDNVRTAIFNAGKQINSWLEETFSRITGDPMPETESWTDRFASMFDSIIDSIDLKGAELNYATAVYEDAVSRYQTANDSYNAYLSADAKTKKAMRGKKSDKAYRAELKNEMDDAWKDYMSVFNADAAYTAAEKAYNDFNKKSKAQQAKIAKAHGMSVKAYKNQLKKDVDEANKLRKNNVSKTLNESMPYYADDGVKLTGNKAVNARKKELNQQKKLDNQAAAAQRKAQRSADRASKLENKKGVSKATKAKANKKALRDQQVADRKTAKAEANRQANERKQIKNQAEYELKQARLKEQKLKELDVKMEEYSTKAGALDKAQDALDKELETIDELKGKWDDVHDTLKDNITALGSMSNATSANVRSAGEYENFLDTQIEAAQNYADNIQKLRDAGYSDEIIQDIIAMGVEEGAQMAQYLLDGADTATVEAIKQKWDTLNTLAEEFSTSMANQMYKPAIDASIEAVKSIAAELGVDLPQEGALVGMALLDGLVKGLQDGFVKKAGELKNVADQIIKLFEDVNKIKSPSKVFARIGAFLMDGLYLGMHGAKDKVLTESELIANDVITAMDKLTNMSYSPTVTPVLDASNLERGLGDIDSSFKTTAELANSIAAQTASNYDQNGSKTASYQIIQNFNDRRATPTQIYNATRFGLSTA